MPHAAETAIGVDVGGTRIRVARIARGGALSDRVIEDVRPDRTGFAEQVVRLVRTVRREGDRAVGIGIPGRVDSASGRILSAGYLDIADLDLAGLVSRETGLPCRVENDATMALIAEQGLRSGTQGGLVFMVTVGTGIGGAAVQDGAPWYGGGLAGQFGHIAVAADGPACKCGAAGCVETFSSGTALERLVTEAGLAEGTRAQTLMSRAEAGDALASEVLGRWALPMRRAIQSLVAMADPRLVLLGGGLGAEMARAIARLPPRESWFGLPIEAARLGDSAGVIGAGLRALDAGDTRRRGATG